MEFENQVIIGVQRLKNGRKTRILYQSKVRVIQVGAGKRKREGALN